MDNNRLLNHGDDNGELRALATESTRADPGHASRGQLLR